MRRTCFVKSGFTCFPRDRRRHKFLTNENIARAVVQALRQAGHDVLSAKESLRGEEDAAILARAQAEERIVVTQDKDFGELAFRFGLSATCGITLFRLSGLGRDADVARIVEVLSSRTD
jgi:predicted nuclease of predicted toxin-antitoxin system